VKRESKATFGAYLALCLVWLSVPNVALLSPYPLSSLVKRESKGNLDDLGYLW
ncbi:Transmembrane domain-containing protein, partial [Cedratvirus Zaza IHUMI]